MTRVLVDAGLAVRSLVVRLERHDQRCQICYLVDECEARKALRWYAGPVEEKE